METFNFQDGMMPESELLLDALDQSDTEVYNMGSPVSVSGSLFADAEFAENCMLPG